VSKRQPFKPPFPSADPFFLVDSDFQDIGERYSGMWWQRVDTFVATNFEPFSYLEAATFRVFTRHEKSAGPGKGVVLTRNWLDFSVEHLSKYVKLLCNPKLKYFALIRQRVEEMLSNYLKHVKKIPHVDVTAYNMRRATLAVLPFKAPSEEDLNGVFALMLAVTIASLTRASFGRIVVVGVSDRDRNIIEDAFKHVKHHGVEYEAVLVVVDYPDAAGDDLKIVPRLAIRGLMESFSSNSSLEAKGIWLGDKPSKWEYVYYSEPDLVLQTNENALRHIESALREDKLVAAHRLELLPHAVDFPSVYDDPSLFLLNSCFLSEIHTLDDDYACCDMGLFYPANSANTSASESVRVTRECDLTWAYCGLWRRDAKYESVEEVLHLHRRLQNYTIIRLATGTGAPLVSANQRACIPRPRILGCT